MVVHLINGIQVESEREYSRLNNEAIKLERAIEILAPREKGNYLVNIDGKFYNLNVYVSNHIDEYYRQVTITEFDESLL